MLATASVELLSDLGWRDIVLALATIIGVYLVLLVLRLFQAAAKRQRGHQPEANHRFSAWEAYSPGRVLPLQPNPAPAELVSSRDLLRSTAEVELDRLRHECTFLHQEVARLEEEVARLKAAHHE